MKRSRKSRKGEMKREKMANNGRAKEKKKEQEERKQKRGQKT